MATSTECIREPIPPLLNVEEAGAQIVAHIERDAAIGAGRRLIPIVVLSRTRGPDVQLHPLRGHGCGCHCRHENCQCRAHGHPTFLVQVDRMSSASHDDGLVDCGFCGALRPGKRIL